MKEITLPKNLRRYRLRIDVTQEQFAEMLEIQRPTYQAYEKGRAEPPASVLLRMARTMNVTVDELCFGDLSQPQLAIEAQKGGGE